MKDFHLDAKHSGLEEEGVVNIDKSLSTKLHSLLNPHTRCLVSRRERTRNWSEDYVFGTWFCPWKPDDLCVFVFILHKD